MTYHEAPDPTSVCAQCVNDVELQRWIAGHASERVCDVCGRRGRRAIAAPFDEFAAHFRQCIESEYEDSAEHNPWDEGAYVFPYMDGNEVLDDVGDVTDSDRLRDALVGVLDDVPWVRQDFLWESRHELLRGGWREFVQLIKHRTRFLFFSREPRDEYSREITAAGMLDALGEVLNELGCLQVLPAGTRLYRVRVHPAAARLSAMTHFGAPPPEAVTRANRMSPVGISMFYAALDRHTAVAETWGTLNAAEREGQRATLAIFELTRDVRVVDLVSLPPLPTIFTPLTTMESRSPVTFLHELAAEFAAPIAREHAELLEYVPTQVVTEFVRYRFSPERPAEGLCFRSARRASSSNVALFLSAEDFAGALDDASMLPLRLLRTRRLPR